MDKIKTLFIFCLVLLVITPFVSSASILIEPFTYPEGRAINVTASCEDINCHDGNIYVSIYREGYLVLDNQTAIKKTGYVYYPFLTNNTGDFLVYFTSDNDDHGVGFSVTVQGDSLSEGESILCLLILIFSMGIFIAFTYGLFKIPWQHMKDVNGITIGVNNKKVWKIVCGVLTYFTLLWNFAILRAIAKTYLFLDIYAIFDWIYWILLVFAIPVFITAVIILFVAWIDIKKVNKWVENQSKFG